MDSKITPTPERNRVIHQQLATAQKLFCSCDANLSTLNPESTFYRRLRPTQSELGEVDPAATFEFQRGKGFLYGADNQTTCLVEMDEEPPHNLNDEAVDICLTIALLVNAKPVDEIHVMRKIVIDGSNTTGFQRTCIAALGGEIEVKSNKISLQTICLEEDAARKTAEEKLLTTYRLDRLCIPLIEIATAPVIYDPKTAQTVALALGRILRSTKKVKRGLGTIRQDINVSIQNGALIEIKGVQQLNLISKVVEYEVQRQIALLDIREELKSRGIEEHDLSTRPVDITQVFEHTKCQVIANTVTQGGKVVATVLPSFGQLFNYELIPEVRFGTELSDYAKFWGGVGGIFHTDELPAYGITEDEVNEINQILKIHNNDVVVFIAASKENAINALEAVKGRARQALLGVPSETREALLDGTTRYSRPRPGAARMYPETDVPPVPITFSRLSQIKQTLPETPEKKMSRFINQYSINQKLADQLADSDYDNLFEIIVNKTKIPATYIAATLTETMKNLAREGVEVDRISHDLLLEVFQTVDNAIIAKEAIPVVLSWIAENKETQDINIAIDALGLKMVSTEKLEQLVDEIIQQNEDLIINRGLAALGPLMGTLMNDYRGKIDAKTASNILKTKIKSKLDE